MSRLPSENERGGVSDATLAHIDRTLKPAGRGGAREVVALSAVERGGGAHLVRTRRGLFLVDADGTFVDVLAPGALRVSLGLFTDRIEVQARALSVSGKERGRSRAIIARARLLSDAPMRTPLPSVFIEHLSGRERAALGVRLPSDARLLLYLHSTTTLSVSSPISDEVTAPLRFGLTPDGAFSLAVSELGDFVFHAHDAPLQANDDGLVASGRLHRPETNRGLWARALELAEASGADRVFLAAAANARAAKSDASFTAATASLLEAARRGDDPRADITAFFCGHALRLEHVPSGDELREAVRRLLRRDDGAATLADGYTALDLDPAAGVQLLSEAQKVAPLTASLPLHARVHSDLLAAEGTAHAQADADYAQHLCGAGQEVRALALVRARLLRLGPHHSGEYLEPDDAPCPVRAVREQLCRVRSSCAAHDEFALASHVEWAAAAPLSAEALAALAQGAPARLAEKARTVLALLDEEGLARTSSISLDRRPRPLDPEDTDALRHPEALHKDMLIGLQEMVAAREKPDVSSLRAFCQRVDPQKHPVLAAAVADAIYCFRLKDIDVFVSAGNKSSGVRAYSDSPRLVLVGEDHLDPSRSDFLDERELRFAVSAEIAHIAFGHIRVTPGQVWQGAWDVGKSGLDLALSLLPAFKGAKIIERVGAVLNVGRKAVKKVDRQTQATIRRESVGVQTEALLEAHRLMQLSADRAGLLLCQDLRAALRGLYLGEPEALGVATRYGLERALDIRADDGGYAHPTRRLRACALIAFFLSAQYDAFSDALFRGATEV